MPDINYNSETWADLVAMLQENLEKEYPEYSDQGPSDIGIALLEQVAAFTRFLKYRQNFIANEAFLATATQRQSLLKFADQLGYTPRMPIAASVDLTFTKAEEDENAIVPAATPVSTAGGGVTFITTEQLFIPSGILEGSVSAIHAQHWDSELLGFSEGTAGQEFQLMHSPVVKRDDTNTLGLEVYVSGEKWSKVDSVKQHLGEEEVYEYRVDADNNLYIIFGDGSNGKVPGEGARIEASYYTGGGSEGLVGAGTINSIDTSLDNVETVTNPEKSTGGRDPLSIEELRESIQSQVTTLERLVTKEDIRRLIPAEVPEVKKVAVEHPRDNLVNVYIMPAGGVPPSDDLIDEVQYYIDEHKVVTDEVLAKAPSVIDVDVSMNVILKEGYNYDLIADIKDRLREYLERWTFDDAIYINDVYKFMEDQIEIKEATINKLARHGETGTQNLSTEIDEVFSAGTISISGEQT